MKILGVHWFSNRSLVGIVRTEDEWDGIKYYITAVSNPSTEDVDAQFVADWGSTFPKEAGDVLFGVK
jgi:hypothetical protein